MSFTRRDISLTIALCASLTLHTLLLRAGADLYNRQFSHISLPGFPRVQVENALLIEPPDDPEHRLGATTGSGESTSESPGQTPLQAAKGPQNQPLLSLDPPGSGKSAAEEQSESQLSQSQPAAAAAPASPAAQATPQSSAESETPFGMDQPANDFATAQQTASSPQAPTQPQQPAQASAQSAGAPMPQGDSESDPITVAGSAVFQHGYAKVRLGRGHKITRPRLSLAAQADLLTLPQPIVVLKLKIDETGHITSATIFRSSGSNSIDEPVKLAAYNWWFEPAKDQTGKPVKDVILFTVGFLN
jgi:TonB family protein